MIQTQKKLHYHKHDISYEEDHNNDNSFEYECNQQTCTEQNEEKVCPGLEWYFEQNTNNQRLWEEEETRTFEEKERNEELDHELMKAFY